MYLLKGNVAQWVFNPKLSIWFFFLPFSSPPKNFLLQKGEKKKKIIKINLSSYVIIFHIKRKGGREEKSEKSGAPKNPDIFFAKFDFPREMENVLLFFTGWVTGDWRVTEVQWSSNNRASLPCLILVFLGSSF